MSRKRADSNRSRKPGSSGARNPAGHHPFRNLGSVVRAAGLELKPLEQVTPEKAETIPSEAAPEDEQALFERAMSDVNPAEWRYLAAPSAPESPSPPPEPQQTDLGLMRDALQGIPALPVTDHPAYIEGWIGIAGKRYLPGLREGVYSIQGHLDLHGLTRSEARQRVEEFIRKHGRLRSCCVKIIHGQGKNSPEDRAVLKEHLQRWLSTRRMSRHVVAYASAPLNDGGVGAVYVLLKRQPR